MSYDHKDDGGRLQRRDRGNDSSLAYGADSEPLAGVPGKSTSTQRPVYAAPEVAARNAVRGALGAVERVVAWGPQLMHAVTTANYGESARLSFEIRSALRRAEMNIADLERRDPDQATRAADAIVDARGRLGTVQRELAMLLRAAPVLEASGAGSAEAEAEWTKARAHANSITELQPKDAEPTWDTDAASMASSLGLGGVSVHGGDTARSITDAKSARGVALGDAIYMSPDRARPGTEEGREVLAHELVHLAQARLPRDAGDGRDAAEHEATSLAPSLARGGSVAPKHYIDLSRPAADKDASPTAIAPDAKAKTPKDTAAERRVAFQSHLGLAHQRLANVVALIAADVPARVDEARMDALGVRMALAELDAAIAPIQEARIALEAAEALLFALDPTHAMGEKELLADAKKTRKEARARIDASYSKDALHGIHLWLQAKDSVADLADGTRDWSKAGPGKTGPYALYAQVKQKRLVFYVAYHEQRRQNEWIVGADDADAFAASVDLYAAAARAALPGSENVAHSQEDGAVGGHVPSTIELEATEGLVDFAAEGMDKANGGGALNAARNAGLRVDVYAKEAKRVADEMLAGLQSGALDHQVARDGAIEGRNEAMRETRRRMSPAARYQSRKSKADEGRSLEYMVERKTQGLIREAVQKPAVKERLIADSPEWEKYIDDEALGVADASTYKNAVEELGGRPEVSKAIIASAGRPNPRMTVFLRYALRPGFTAMGGLGVLDMVKQVADAKEGERLHAAARELGGFAGGIVGGEMGSMAAVFIASAIVTSAGVLLVVSLIGGFVGSVVGATAGSMMTQAVEHTAQAGPLAAKAAMPMTASAAGGGFAGMLDRNQRNAARSGVVNALEDYLFEIDTELRALEGQIGEAPDRATMEQLQQRRLSILSGREVYDQLLLASRTGRMDETEIADFIRENDL
jgi:hypothetical protein